MEWNVGFDVMYQWRCNLQFLLGLSQWLAAEGLLSLGCLCVHVSVRDHIVIGSEHDILQTTCGNFA